MNDEDFRKNPRTALLLDAADLLERLAERCVPGPWKVDGRDVVPMNDEWSDIATNCVSADEADWIALMNPVIAPFLIDTLRDRGRGLYVNEGVSGNTIVTRDFIKAEYGSLLDMAAEMLGKEVPWEDFT